MDRKFPKKYFFPPQVCRRRRCRPRGGIYPENISFHLRYSTPRRESPTLRVVGSSSTSSKLWTLSSDTRDSQFGLTRAHASVQGRRKLTCDDKRAARSTDRNFLRRAFPSYKTLHSASTLHRIEKWFTSPGNLLFAGVQRVFSSCR